MEQPHFKRLINAEHILSSHATHVVIGIDWGSCNILSLTGSEEDGQNANDLKVGVVRTFFLKI